MTTEGSANDTRGQSIWVIPGVAVTIGIAYLIAGVASGDTWFGVGGLGLMVGVAAVLLAVRWRSETVRGLLDRRDERINSIDLQSTAFAGVVLILVVLVAFVVDVARGGDGQPYASLGAVAGVAYVVGVVYNRLRT